MEELSPLEPTVPGAVLRYRRLFVAVVSAFLLVGLLLALTRSAGYVGTAELVVQDPRESRVFDASDSATPERYVADQVAILESPRVAGRAAEILAEDGADLGRSDVAKQASVSSAPDSSLLVISFRSDDAGLAVDGANAVVDAYRDVRRSEAQANSASAVEELDHQIAEVDSQRAENEEEISALLGGEAGPGSIEDQLRDTIDQLLALTEGSPGATQAIAELSAQLEALRLAAQAQEQQPELAALLLEREALVTQRSELVSRRAELEVNREIESSGVVLSSPAVAPPDRAGSGRVRTVVLALVLGMLAGAAVTYLLALRRRQFQDRNQPELVLGAPLIADIPDFTSARFETGLPVVEVPTSPAAEAFGFAAASLDISRHAEGGVSFAVVSASPGDGKSTVSANVAVALAQTGLNVLLVDADFDHQGSTELLLGDEAAHLGLRDVLRGERTVEEVLQTLYVQGSRLTVLPAGHDRRPTPVLTAVDARRVFASVQRRYDVVLIDGPPLLQIAFSAAVVSYADRALVVVNHGAAVQVHEELAERLRFIGTDVAGYVYNRAPLRPELGGYYYSPPPDGQSRKAQANGRRSRSRSPEEAPAAGTSTP